MTRLALLDHGFGNLRSAEKAIERAGADVTRAADPAAAAGADGLVLPGVGAFPGAIERVRELGFDKLLRERHAQGVPILGICLGMQLLFDRSAEGEGAEGLGLLGGEVIPLAADGLKVPHIGWTPVRWEQDSELTAGLGPEPSFYFVHSFAAAPASHSDLLGSAGYGERFAAAVARPPLYGCQFHPEKSSSAGLALLANFVRICAAR